MSKDIQIEYKHYRLPAKIVIDDVEYPNTQHNWNVIAEYENTKDENVLDKLTKFSFEI